MALNQSLANINNLFVRSPFRIDPLVILSRGIKNPRIFPRAKTKLFTIRQPTPQDSVEKELLQKWWSQYRMEMASIFDLYKYQYTELERAKQEAEKRDDIADHKMKMAVNDEWNATTSIAREKNMREVFERTVAARVNAQTSHEERLAARVAKMQTKLQHDMEALKSMITEENIDEKIEEILCSDIVSYNFSLHPDGTTNRSSADVPLGRGPPSGGEQSSVSQRGITKSDKELSVEV